MAGSAVLGTNLVDSLVSDVIDGIRGELHPLLGVRQFNMSAITRTWTGIAVGEGSFTDVTLVIGLDTDETSPQPLVLPYRTRLDLEPCGIDEAGFVMVREVSLSYTEAELAGPPSSPETEELYIQISDAHGQAIPTTYWHSVVRPYPDRIKDMGWVMQLEPASIPEGL